MKTAELKELQRLALQHGIHPSYRDACGEKKEIAPETLTALLKLWQVEAENPRQVRFELMKVKERAKLRQEIVVCWDGKFAQKNCEVLLESGERLQFTSRGETADLPLGYHELIDRHGKTLILSAPRTSYREPGHTKRWGVFAPMYALHSETSWGAGNLSDWRRLSAWVKALGGDFIGTLPLLATFLDGPVVEPSPYSPASRLFWNEFFVDPASLPEFSISAAAQRKFRSKRFQQQLAVLRKKPRVDYPREMALKRELLELLAEEFFSAGEAVNAAFRRFLADTPELKLYAAFRAICEKQERAWTEWPEKLRGGSLAGHFDEQSARYHAFVQWIAEEQFSATAKPARGASLYLDLPLGVNPAAFDVWRHQNLFVLQANVGAPPDAFFTKGQDWGFAPLHPERLRESGFRYLRDYLHFQMSHASILRIDHVMNLHRLYWVPRGFPPGAGAYVQYPTEELFAIYSLESHRHRTLLVGENLGTVPKEIDRGMTRHGIRKMYVVQYEQRMDAATLPAPPRACAASLNTHDMPAFASMARGLDLGDRVALGLIPRRHLVRERKKRKKLLNLLWRFLRREKWVGQSRSLEELLLGCLRFLAASKADLVLVNLEDLWLETRPQNTPGTSTERVNWRRKMRWSIEEIMRSPTVLRMLREVNRLRNEPVRQRAWVRLKT